MNNFIGIYDDIIDKEYCNSLIDLYNNSDNKQPGIVNSCYGNINKNLIKKDVKDSTEILLTPETPFFFEYINRLEVAVDKYKNQYKFCNEYSPWGIVQPINFQHYRPGGGFKKWHCERGNPYPSVGSDRHLVFMTYLNTIDEEDFKGGTEWYYQKLKVNAKQGRTVIWPVDWTFTHRGIVTNNFDKYIITGWFSYINNN